MFFIARCIFWLSLVYLHLPGGTGGLTAAAFLDMAGNHADALTRQSATVLASTAVENGQEWCKLHGDACVDAVLTAMMAKVPERSRPDGKPAGSKAGVTSPSSLLDRLLHTRS